MNADHFELLRQGTSVWNEWRKQAPAITPDLHWAVIRNASLANANLDGADIRWADFVDADLNGARLRGAKLERTNLLGAKLSHADLRNAELQDADLRNTTLVKAKLERACLIRADLSGANLTKANLRKASLMGVSMIEANLAGADLSGATLYHANLVGADLRGADLTGCHIYGVSVWEPKIDQSTKQDNLVITKPYGDEITVDNIEVGQFVYLLLHNERIREAIDTIGKKGVLLLGRFAGGRIAVLERLRDELRRRDFLPIVFSFDKPETKSFTETVRLLAGMSRFVIADITNPRSSPLELQATIPECLVPFAPILDKNDDREPFAMLTDLQIAHPDRVLDVIRYPSVDRLVEILDAEIIAPAQLRFVELQARKALGMRIRDV
jgi:hypothetical protein